MSVTNGRKNVTPANDKVMPVVLRTNVNVMCYLDDIYVYLRARANDAIPGGRPPTHRGQARSCQTGRSKLHRYQIKPIYGDERSRRPG